MPQAYRRALRVPQLLPASAQDVLEDGEIVDSGDESDDSGGSALDPYAFDMVAWQVLLAAWVAINAGFAFRALHLRHKRHRLHTRDEEHKGHLRARCRAVAAAPVTPQ
jgi:hypothetical protein